MSYQHRDPPEAKRPPAYGRMKRETFLRRHLKEVAEDIEEARADRKWPAVAALRRRLDLVRAALDEVLVEKALEEEKLTATTEEDFLDHLRETAEEMPEHHLEVFVREFLDRKHLELKPAPPRLVGGANN
jgi:hypothetical protein